MTDDPSPAPPAPFQRRPVHEKSAPGATLPPATALHLELRMMEELKELLWIPEGMPEAMVNARLVQAMELYQSLAPQDGMEGMLALQMIGTHNAAMECLRRAAIPNQTFEGRDMALKHAHKLMTLYAQQTAMLAKHQAQRPRRAPVEQVDGPAGGTAASISPAAPLAIEHHREMPADLTLAREPVTGRQRS